MPIDIFLMGCEQNELAEKFLLELDSISKYLMELVMNIKAILSEQVGEVLTITFNKPKSKNAIGFQMYTDLTGELEYAKSCSSIKLVILHGEEVFCAGNDLRDFAAAPDQANIMNGARDFLLAISSFPKPIIAAVNGLAIGIGATMLLHCDLVFCDADTKFSYPFVKLGVVPEGGSSLLLPQRLGHRHTFELLALGDFIGPDQAKELGLVNDVVSSEDVLQYATHYADRLLALPYKSLLKTKEMLKKSQADVVKNVINEEIDRFYEALCAEEAREAITAVLEKRPPKFNN
ncbi:enoyl-CoA hydratase-related protein [Sessilibacter corallicola]